MFTKIFREKFRLTNRKGLILAGGSGTRLHPVTLAMSKQLLPIYDKPMVYYSLSTLMLGGIRDILLISTPQDIQRYQILLGDGSQWGVNLRYCVQKAPNGIAEAFLLGRNFIGKDPSALILGDNVFYGHDFGQILKQADERNKGATVFAHHVNDPERYGVVEFDAHLKVVNIVEKPIQPSTNYAVTGLYFYDNRVCEIASQLVPSSRGELEITDINNTYLGSQDLNVEILGRGYAWFDTGTHESLHEAASFVGTLQKRQGHMICCPEEIAFHNGWINHDALERLAAPLMKSEYGKYLRRLCENS